MPLEHLSAPKLRSRHSQLVAEQHRVSRGNEDDSSAAGTSDPWAYPRNGSTHSEQDDPRTYPKDRHLHRLQQTLRQEHPRKTERVRCVTILVGMILLRSSLVLFTKRKHLRVVIWDVHLFDTESTFRLPVKVVTTSFPQPLSEKTPLSRSDGDPDFGSLVFEQQQPCCTAGSVDENKGIQISPTDYLRAERQRARYLKDIDDSVTDKFLPESSKADRDTRCRLPAYATSFPTCNTVHELVMHSQQHRDDEIDISYLNHGYYRDALRYRSQISFSSDHFVMKRMRLKRSHNYINLARVQTEAIILERLTPSPHILDIYSHCGLSVLVEAMASDINNLIVPPTGYMLQSKLDELQEIDVFPRNNFTLSEKLQIALDMGESLADLHGLDIGMVVHADVHLDQWLLAPDGSVKLNDFGDARRVSWDRKSKEFCFESATYHSGTWRSPEEYMDGPLDEMVDVYVFGNSIYTLLTGLWPYYDEEYREVDYHIVRHEIVNLGKRPFLDPRYRSHSFIESKLVDIMEQCWAPKHKRVTIFEVVKSLRELKRLAARMGILESSTVINIPMISPDEL